MSNVTGIGGVFFKARKDAKVLSSWYQKNLGVNFEVSGAVELKWKEDTAEDNGITHWCIAEKDSEWFSPSSANFMVNYRVDDMEGMIRQLKEAGTDLFQGPEAHENGIFAWVLDPDGNKIELWEPKIWDEKNKDKLRLGCR